GEQPADNAADLRRGRWPRPAERILRQQQVDRAVDAPQQRQCRQAEPERADRWQTQSRPHGQSTVILLTNIMPKSALVPFAKACPPRFWASAVPSLGSWTLSWQAAGAPVSLTAF